ncbi:MAG: DUF4302 domain-containing protein [Prevotellaceae bacterium]|jgi:hypothetical protein|nr:DUF4302 domain-containing protein [Prevotellaceae bacterium]
MKRKTFLHLIFTAAAAMVACTETEPPVFDLSPDERAQAQLEQYRQILCGAPCGWLVAVGSQDLGVAGGAYRFWIKFRPDNKVTMCGDIDATTAATPKESTYRLKQMQYPTLLFDTYSYIHMPDDPDKAIPDATSGVGLLSDSDVNLMGDVSGNEFRAVGRKRRCPFIFTRATPEDTLAVLKGDLIAVKETAAARWMGCKYPTVATTQTHLQMTVGKRLSSFTYADENNEVQTVFIPTYAELDANNIRLITPFKYKNIEFERITWNGTDYTVSINGEPHLVYDNRQPSYPLSFGPGKPYNTLTVDKSVLNSSAGSIMVAPFLTIYDKMYSDAFVSGIDIRSFTLTFEMNELYEEQMRLSVAYSKASVSKTGEAIFKVNREADALYLTGFRLPQTDEGVNMDSIGRAISGSLLTYLLHSGSADSLGMAGHRTAVAPSGNKFRADWAVNSIPELTQAVGRLVKIDEPGNYMPGILGKQE